MVNLESAQASPPRVMGGRDVKGEADEGKELKEGKEENRNTGKFSGR